MGPSNVDVMLESMGDAGQRFKTTTRSTVPWVRMTRSDPAHVRAQRGQLRAMISAALAEMPTATLR